MDDLRISTGAHSVHSAASQSIPAPCAIIRYDTLCAYGIRCKRIGQHFLLFFHAHPSWGVFISSPLPHCRDANGRVSSIVFPIGKCRSLTRHHRDRVGPDLRQHLPKGPIMPSVSLRANARNKVTTTTAAAMPIPSTAASLLLPETGFLRQAQVLVFVPFSKSTLWRRIQAKTFPQPIKLSERVTAWRAEDIRRWITEQGG